MSETLARALSEILDGGIRVPSDLYVPPAGAPEPEEYAPLISRASFDIGALTKLHRLLIEDGRGRSLDETPAPTIARGRGIDYVSVRALSEDRRYAVRSRLAVWLVVLAYKRGIDYALRRLDEVSIRPVIECQELLTLSNVTVEEPCSVGNGIQLTPYAVEKGGEILRGLRGYFGRQYTGVAELVYRNFLPQATLVYKFERRFDSQVEAAPRKKIMEDICLCLSIMPDQCPYPLEHTVVALTWLPTNIAGGSGSSIPTYNNIASYSPPPVLKREDFNGFPELMQDYWRLERKTKRKGEQKVGDVVDACLNQLRSFKLRKNPIDGWGAVELAAALEALFLSADEKQEFSFRMGIRAAWLLGRDQEDRARLFRIVHQIYNARSGIVHGGRKREKVPEELLKHGETICIRALKKIIGNGQLPSWEKVVLG